MNERKELMKSQAYAARAAITKVAQAERELQGVVNDIAVELGVNFKDEKWGISADIKYLERKDIPAIPAKEKE